MIGKRQRDSMNGSVTIRKECGKHGRTVAESIEGAWLDGGQASAEDRVCTTGKSVSNTRCQFLCF